MISFCSLLIITSFVGCFGKLTDSDSNTYNRNISVTTTKNPVNVITTTAKPLAGQSLRLPCSCSDGECGCCTGVVLEQFRQKFCVNMTYNPDDFELTAQISSNKKVLYKNSFSGKNPPPMCIRVPRFQFIQFCLEFSNVYFVKRNIHLCISAEASWQDFSLMEWSFNCVRLGASGVAVVRPEDGGGLGVSPGDVDQTDEDYDDNARHLLIPIAHAKSNAIIPISVKQLKDGYVFISYDDKRIR